MSISIQIPDDFFTEEERDLLKDLFEVEDEEEFEAAIEKVVRAALSEYKDMFLGINLPSRANEVREHRLLYLVEHYWRETIPSESKVSEMFQLTPLRSRSLIESVMAKFRYNVSAQIENTLKKTVEQCKSDQASETHRVVIESRNVLERLNTIIAEEGAMLESIKKAPNTSRQYVIPEDSYDALCKRFDIKRDE